MIPIGTKAYIKHCLIYLVFDVVDLHAAVVFMLAVIEKNNRFYALIVFVVQFLPCSTKPSLTTCYIHNLRTYKNDKKYLLPSSLERLTTLSYKIILSFL